MTGEKNHIEKSNTMVDWETLRHSRSGDRGHVKTLSACRLETADTVEGERKRKKKKEGCIRGCEELQPYIFETRKVEI
jgi:hypothetical protein